jgi:hypothetical protein
MIDPRFQFEFKIIHLNSKISHFHRLRSKKFRKKSKKIKFRPLSTYIQTSRFLQFEFIITRLNPNYYVL